MSIVLAAADPVAPEVLALSRKASAEFDVDYPGHPLNDVDMAEFKEAGGYLVVASADGRLLGCGGFRPAEFGCAEIKRVYVSPEARRRGLARRILRHLEYEIGRRGYQTVVLETAIRQHDAIALYLAEGYFPIPRFLGYADEPLSRCFAKPAPHP